MAAPKRNQFWRNRSTHGREKLFATAHLLKEASEEYFNWVDAHPLYNVEAVKSGDNAGMLIKVPISRPYTLSGLCTYVGCSESYFRVFRNTSKPSDEDFLTVIEEIENIITTQQFEGAAVGHFNANIIARKQGLKEQTDITTNNKDVLTDKSYEELKSLLSKTIEKLDA
jgi:DNA-packaging protein gp3